MLFSLTLLKVIDTFSDAGCTPNQSNKSTTVASVADKYTDRRKAVQESIPLIDAT